MQDLHSAFPRLSQLFVDPMVRAAFERAERDQGQAGACLPPPQPHLPHGSAEQGFALRQRRAEVERAVEEMIDLLDVLDAADEDREDGADDELLLGAPERHPSSRCMWSPSRDRSVYASQLHWADGATDPEIDDGEAEAGYDLPEGDDERCGSEHDGCEPSLGATEHQRDQALWAQGENDDREANHEDASIPGGGMDVRRTIDMLEAIMGGVA